MIRTGICTVCYECLMKRGHMFCSLYKDICYYCTHYDEPYPLLREYTQNGNDFRWLIALVRELEKEGYIITTEYNRIDLLIKPTLPDLYEYEDGNLLYLFCLEKNHYDE